VNSSLQNSPSTNTGSGAPNRGFFRGENGQNYTFTFFLVASLFLLWGVCNGMIDVMDRHFQSYLHLTLAQSANVQWAHYLGYFLMALPAGLLTRRIGYKGGIITGLIFVALGGVWFIPATSIAQFWAYLLGVCFIAMGLTVLETVANPYTTVLGGKQYAAARINLAQSFNGVGWIAGPIIGGRFFYASSGVEAAHAQLYIPYLVIAIVVLVLAAVFFFSPVPDLNTADEYHVDDKQLSVVKRSIWTHPHFVGGVAAQFFYVAAQAGIFSFFIFYMIRDVPALTAGITDNGFVHFLLGGNGTVVKDGVTNISEQGASTLLGTLGFPLFLLGRITGAWILKKAPAHKILGLYSLLNIFVCLTVILQLGWISVAAVCLSFFFMSISFPTIFALGIYGLGVQAKKASAFIVMAIMGGAIMPKFMGWLGDHYGISYSFLMPMGCFVLISIYGFSWSKLSKAKGLSGA
jgi:MFS transporter, FHS family, L-fucose permease